MLEPESMDLDANAIHQGFLRGLRARGGRVVTDAEVLSLERSGGVWRIRTPGESFAAPVVVNAAGAWADAVARLAGVAPIGLVPKRRTALTFNPPEGLQIDGWPMVVDASEAFYFKPDAGRILLSPADETPCDPCDAQPDELDVAIAVDRLEQATDLQVRRIHSKWAGLRSFVADRTPVAGFDPAAEGFFWLAGQGGYGIQTSPTMGRIAAALASDAPMPPDLVDRGVTEAALSPGRLCERSTAPAATAGEASSLARATPGPAPAR
jgi:D-arginine dehydrogenase